MTVVVQRPSVTAVWSGPQAKNRVSASVPPPEAQSVTVVDFALVAAGQAVRPGAAAVAGMTVSVMRWY